MNRWHTLPGEVFSLVEHTPSAVLLDCSKSAAQPWTRLLLEPQAVCCARTPAEIPALFAQIEQAVAVGLTAAGYFAYECATAFEPKAHVVPPGSGEPLAWFGFYERSYRFDHSTGCFLDPPPGLDRFAAPDPLAEAELTPVFSLDAGEYARRIEAIHGYIRSGDIYQLNFTAPFRFRTAASAAALYARLRGRQPVEYGALLHTAPGHHILSLSPELFFRIDEDRRIVTRPMKGTTARGRTASEDRQQARWLTNDPKNRAENLMIVDLLRNDLGRLAEFGSVRVENLFEAERYPALWQMTSTVSAQLRNRTSFHDVFRALFPCGSITGAPKVRAMQLIAELEGRPRGVYTGAIGFFSAEQTVFNVAIRTLEVEAGEAVMGVGGGIVADSDAAAEYRECLLKADFLSGPPFRAISPVVQAEGFILIESLLWNGSYPFIEQHLDRLTDSAGYFSFACDRNALRVALEQHASGFADTSPRKVRLLLTDAEGSFNICSEAVPPSSGIGRVTLSPQRTDPADPTLYHKTSQRALYALELVRSRSRGYDDVLFFNLRGELTEGAISNVFVEIGGRLLTPPVECGLLAGVYRRHILETRTDAAKQVLTADDLRRADAIYITNAVRGLRRVEIDWPA